MALLTRANKFIDLGASGVSPLNSGTDNRTAFQRAITSLSAAAAAPLPRSEGTLYLPEGRYLIAADETVLDNWRANLQTRSADDIPPAAALQIDRQGPARLGASLLVPDGMTLWLAPGAVLVPEAHCIINILSTLVAEDVQIFDTSRNGLVVFGTEVPIVRPEWWGVGSEDDSHAVQSAIDAAVHNRGIRWLIAGSGSQTITLPPLEVLLRGRYRIGKTLRVHGDTSSNGIVAALRPTDGTASGVDSPLPNTVALLGGVWDGRSRQGATLVATPALRQRPILILHYCPGLSLRNLGFEAIEPGYQPCLELRIFTVRPSSAPASAHQINVRGCRFSGPSTPLVQVGQRVEVLLQATDFHPPLARPTFGGSDFSMLAFDECEFAPSGGIAVDCGAQQTLPIRYRRCDFIGDADAMLSLWDATHFIDGCYFDNSRRRFNDAPAPYSSALRGSEPPDGTDIHLRMDFPEGLLDFRNAQSVAINDGFPYGMPIPDYDYLPGLVAFGCVSRSECFLSTVAPTPRVLQQQEWPVVLLNVRHDPARRPDGPSVLWGMQNHTSARVTGGDRGNERMGRGAPLVVLGGVFARQIVVMRGAVQCAVVGARVLAREQVVVMHDQRTTLVHVGGVPQALPLTYVFGLPDDQPASLRP